MKTTTLLVLLLSILSFNKVLSQANNFEWAKKIGSSGDDFGVSIATDAAGNVYTLGTFQGTVDFDPGSGTASFTSIGASDIFIQKMSSAGNYVWAKVLGGASDDLADAITLDASGNVIVTGSFSGTADFDPGSGVSNLTSFGDFDIYVLKLDASGNFIWVKQLGGVGKDVGVDVTNDASGNVITTGYFEGSADFDPSVTVANLGAVGVYDIFVSKLDANGNYLWAKGMGGIDFDFGNSVATDDAGNIITTGFFQQTADFDPGAAVLSFTSSGVYDIFIQKLDPSGNLVWAKQMGGFGEDVGFGVVTGKGGDIYSTGYFQNVVDFDPGAGTTSLTTTGGGYIDDIYVQKLDAAGNFVWAVNMGGASGDRGLAIAKDKFDNIITTGFHSGSGDFDPGSGVYNMTGNGAFISKLDSNGGFIWAKEMSTSQGNATTTDLTGNVFTTGIFDHTVDFDPGSGQFNLASSSGTTDAFVQKLALSTVGINENFAQNFSAFPNPTNGLFHIEFNKPFAETKIEINDLLGKLIYSEVFSNTRMVQINLNDKKDEHTFKPGCYLVSVTAGEIKNSFLLITQ